MANINSSFLVIPFLKTVGSTVGHPPPPRKNSMATAQISLLTCGIWNSGNPWSSSKPLFYRK